MSFLVTIYDIKDTGFAIIFDNTTWIDLLPWFFLIISVGQVAEDSKHKKI